MSITGDNNFTTGQINKTTKLTDVICSNDDFRTFRRSKHRRMNDNNEEETFLNTFVKRTNDWENNDFSKVNNIDSVVKRDENLSTRNITNDDEMIVPNTRKKKKRKFLTICTSNCKYDVIRRIAGRYGMREVSEDSSWNLYWTDLSISIERAKDMKRYQKINHFPGMTEICRKDLLARNLNRMLRIFPKDYNFFPKTWCFPADHGEAVAYAKVRRSKTFIIKPETGCQGRGIYITKNLKEVKPYDRMICQVYLAKPFLLDGFKFDLRVYALITSCDPLRMYVYNDGLARFATSRYKEPTGHNTSNVFMHLTNYSVNKHSHMYVVDDENGSKRKISTLNKCLKTRDIDVDEIWRRIDEIIIKTVISAYPVLKHSYHTCFPTHDLTYACFEILGFDIILDWKLKPYLLEVNHSPSFHTDAQIDKDVKESLLNDTFEMLNFHNCDKRKVMEEDKKRIRDRLLHGINVKDLNVTESTIGLTKIEKIDEDPIREQYKWEDEHMGNFRRIYPCSDSEKYILFFKQSGTSMFQDTVASRARQEASNVQRAEIDMNAKMKLKETLDAKRVCGGKWSEQKFGLESPSGFNNRMNSAIASYEKRAVNDNLTSNVKKSLVTRTKSSTIVPAPFEPEAISETEERERVKSLAQRDFLIKSSGLIEHIYMAMLKNDGLRPADIKLYGMYEKPRIYNKK